VRDGLLQRGSEDGVRADLEEDVDGVLREEGLDGREEQDGLAEV
jgi:hypothetical protein